MKIPFILLILFLFSGISASEEETLMVRLATENKLMPVYVVKTYSENSCFNQAYIQKIENVLRFDLNHNGMTLVVKNDSADEAGSFNEFGNALIWKKFNVFYVIKACITDKSLNVRVYSVNGHLNKNSEAIPLTGQLEKDRRSVHQLADMLHKALFGTEGIASTKFLYTQKVKIEGDKWGAEVWEADYDGHNARQLTNERSYCINPVYVPPRPGYSCGSFFYVSYKTGQSKIYMASLNEGKGQRFSLLKGNQLMPAISRQRDKIVFISDFTGNPDLFLQPFSPEEGVLGKPQQIFATQQATQGTPTLSPEGKRVAFVSNKDGSPRVYVMDIPAPGTKFKDIKATLISKQNKESSAPAWSPDGSKIAFCAMTNGVRQIWIYELDKNLERQITQGGGHKENPAWAPNSLHLIFNSTGREGSELYLINLNQPHAQKISNGPGDKQFPSWEMRN